ncbi:MAG: decaprenyl-phosphate phosphoribosyltransferase [Candidatus Levyibacteriota bacterium]|nr:MAG: decaprenyl-phosphate phosphoribosyltransferase [Candidatus Levybacteria bacterium]
MIKKAFSTLKLLRPRQWIKNLAVFAAITFNGGLLNTVLLQQVLVAFFIFCGLSSAIYIMNDIFDIEKDRLHPFKKFRPLANRSLSISFALIIAFVLTALSLWAGSSIGKGFFILMITYLFLQVYYSMVLKHIAIIDILALAGGYILRVYAGEFATGLHISVWLLLTTISISLFLAIGKRRSELTLISKYSDAQKKLVRSSLSHYSERLLDVYASIFATSTFITYALFTFLENQTGYKPSFGFLMPQFLPEFLQKKWLMITIIPVVYGLMRYLQDIYEKHEGESPDKVLLSDRPLLITVIIWVVLVISTIYLFGG